MLNFLKSLFAGDPATSLFNRFYRGRNPDDIVAAAKEIDRHLRERGQMSDQLTDLLRPKKPTPAFGPTGNPVMDLTGGRPDTPQWIGFQLILESSNPYYDEYFDWIRRNRSTISVSWFRTVLKHMKPSLHENHQEACAKLINDL